MYYSSALENDKAVGTQIKELVFMRDYLYFEEFHLSRNEMCDVIFFIQPLTSSYVLKHITQCGFYLCYFYKLLQLVFFFLEHFLYYVFYKHE